MGFKNSSEISEQFSQIFETIKKLPQHPCRRCGTLQRTYESDIICYSCQEEEERICAERRRKACQIETLLRLSNIPKRYKNAIFKPKTAIQEQTIDYLKQNFNKKLLTESSDTLLFGSIGTGKTYLGCAFALEAIKTRQIGVRYITEYALLSLYFEKEYETFKKFKSCDILIIDEIGKRILAEWQRVQLEELLSHRYNEMLPTIYITNLEQKAFKDFLGSRLADRLRENHLKRFTFDGESLRG